MTMILKTFAVVALATTAIVSSASAEGSIGCDSGLSRGATQSTSCRLNATHARSAQRAFARAPQASEKKAQQVYNPDPNTTVKSWGGVEM